jgi:hypothetical protein
MKILPYALGGTVLLILIFTIWVSTLPPPPIKVENTFTMANTNGKGMSFEEASRTEKVSVNVGEEEDNVLNLDLNGDVVNLDGEL